MKVTKNQFQVGRMEVSEHGVSLLVYHPKFYGGSESIDNYAEDIEHCWMQAIETVEDYLNDPEEFSQWAEDEKAMWEAEYQDLWDRGVDDSLAAHLL